MGGEAGRDGKRKDSTTARRRTRTRNKMESIISLVGGWLKWPVRMCVGCKMVRQSDGGSKDMGKKGAFVVVSGGGEIASI